jgi:hypothetical protein
MSTFAMDPIDPDADCLAPQVREDARDLEEAVKALERINAGGRTISLENLAAELGIILK